MKLYAVFQAEKLGEKGISFKYKNGIQGAITIFTTHIEARDWLKNLLVAIAHEQSIGWRTADNLDPSKKLDFYIGTLNVELTPETTNDMKSRGWLIDQL